MPNYDNYKTKLMRSMLANSPYDVSLSTLAGKALWVTGTSDNEVSGLSGDDDFLPNDPAGEFVLSNDIHLAESILINEMVSGRKHIPISLAESITLSENVNVPANALFVLLIGQSNSVGEGDYAASSGVINIDPMEKHEVAFPAVPINSQWAQNSSDPPPWETNPTQDLQPYDSAGSPNMGVELTLGRGLFNFSGRPVYLAKFAVAGSAIAKWLSGSSYPSTPPNLFNQLVAFITDRITEFGAPLSAVVWHQGESDAIVQADADAYQTNLTTFVTALRAQFTNGFYFLINRLSDSQSVTGDNAITTIQAKEDAYVAANPSNSGIANTDSLFVPGGLHFSPRAYETIGDIDAKKILDKIAPITPDPGPPPRFVGGDTGQIWSFVTPQPYMSPRWWEFAQDGDIALLVSWGASSSAGGALNDLATANGFSLVDSIMSNISSTDQAWLGVWWARKSGATPFPTLNFNNDYNSSRIFIFRGCAASGNPVDTSSKAAAGTRGTAVTIPGSTTTAASDLVVSFICADSSSDNVLSSVTNSDLASLLLKQQGCYRLLAPFTNKELFSISTGTKTVAGAYGNTTATLSQSSKWAGMTVALKSA